MSVGWMPFMVPRMTCQKRIARHMYITAIWLNMHWQAETLCMPRQISKACRTHVSTATAWDSPDRHVIALPDLGGRQPLPVHPRHPA